MELTKEQILNADDLPRKKLKIPEWGGDVYICKLSAKERDAWEGICLEVGSCLEKSEFKKYASMRIKETLIYYALCDKNGNKLFTNLEDIEKLGNKAGHVIDRISEDIQNFNKISEKDLDDIEKNLESVQENSSK